MESHTDTLDRASAADPLDWFFILNWRCDPALCRSTSWPFLVGGWLVCADAVSIGWCKYTPECPLSIEFLSRNNARLSAIRKFVLPIVEAAPLLTFETPWTTEAEFAGDVIWYRDHKYATDLLGRSPVPHGDQTKHQVSHLEINAKDDEGKSVGKSMGLVTKWGKNAYSLIAPC